MEMNTSTINQGKPDLKLLAFLDKLVNPIGKVNFKLQIEGVFAFPEEWKVADDANPTIFTYEARLSNANLTQGKIQARQLTEKEIKEAEEAALAKKKVKKDPKNEPPPPSPEEIERLKKIQEELEEEERKKQAEWDALDEKTKFYRTYEDKYKHPCIKFETNVKEIEKIEEELVIFEERVNDDKGDWLYFVKTVTLTEEEIVKMRKSKPKNLKLDDLNTVVMRSWVDYNELLTPGKTEMVQRCKLEQYFGDLKEGESPPNDLPRPNLENTYVLINITLDPAITPLIKEIQPKASDLIPKVQPIPKLPSAIECVNEFKSDLVIIIESLAMEYKSVVGKDSSAAQEQKGKNTLTIQKKEEINKRKEHFLHDFNVSGKYKILKERLKKSIVNICRDKFNKIGSITGITLDQKDQFYSELYVFLIDEMRKTLEEVIKSKREELHEDIIVGYDQTLKERDKILLQVTKESPQETLQKLANEYEILNNLVLAEKQLTELLAQNERDPKYWFVYSKFCLRHKNFPKAEEALTEALTYDPTNLEYKLLMVCLYIRRGRHKEALIFLNSLLEEDKLNSLYNSLISFIYGSYLNDQKLAKKYHAVAERIFMRSQNILPPKATHKTIANPFELPDYKSKSIASMNEVKKVPLLTNDQQDDIYTLMIDFFEKNQMIDLVEKAMGLIFDKTTTKALIFQSHVELFKGNNIEATQLLNKVLEHNPKNYDVLLMKANICFLYDKFYEAEETFFKAMKLKGQKNFSIYLRLGYIYLKRKSWGDAKAIFAKACEIKTNSPLAWLGLGISSFRAGDFKEAEEALMQSNIYDPLNYSTWAYLGLLCLKDGNRFIQANQSLREMFKNVILDADILLELADELLKIDKFELAENCLKKIITLVEEGKDIASSTIAEAQVRMGKILIIQNKGELARKVLEEALAQLEGENEKAQVYKLLDGIYPNDISSS